LVREVAEAVRPTSIGMGARGAAACVVGPDGSAAEHPIRDAHLVARAHAPNAIAAGCAAASTRCRVLSAGSASPTGARRGSGSAAQRTCVVSRRPRCVGVLTTSDSGRTLEGEPAHDRARQQPSDATPRLHLLPFVPRWSRRGEYRGFEPAATLNGRRPVPGDRHGRTSVKRRLNRLRPLAARRGAHRRPASRA
jgi:hypothetical protein